MSALPTVLEDNRIEITLEEALCMTSGRKLADGNSPFAKIKTKLPEGVQLISMRIISNTTIEVTHSNGVTHLTLHSNTTKRAIGILKGFGNA